MQGWTVRSLPGEREENVKFFILFYLKGCCQITVNFCPLDPVPASFQVG